MLLDKLRHLREEIEAAEKRYRDVIRIEQEFFESRFTGATADEISENYDRWAEQYKQVMTALNEYQTAVNSYLAASGVHLRDA